MKQVDPVAHVLTIEAAGGPVSLGLDRNTLVYGPTGLVTPLDLTPGALVRAGRNADALAYWIQIRAPARPATPAAPPGQGSSPTGGAGPPPTEGSPDAGSAPVSPIAPGAPLPGGNPLPPGG
ncbi:MAG TPA: hypothetical protein VML50_02385 [Anaeromyxobacter sp.]|nr:hypothetical protein [Anaeromyxobacter sp.]